MHEELFAGGTLAAGLLWGSAVLFAASPKKSLQMQRPQWHEHRRLVAAHALLASCIRRAGWSETPERVAVLALVWSAAAGALGLSSGLLLGWQTAASLAMTGAAAALASTVQTLRSAISARRTRLARELAPLLELFILELGGGGSALSALGSVTLQLDGELAYDLRRLLIASQVSGSASFEVRLTQYAQELRLPALASLATIIAASREYGTSVAPGVRAMAADLRQSQRRDLIVQSRRALNHVLFPAAIGVLLPFLCILLFPAVTTLQRSLR